MLLLLANAIAEISRHVFDRLENARNAIRIVLKVPEHFGEIWRTSSSVARDRLRERPSIAAVMMAGSGLGEIRNHIHLAFFDARRSSRRSAILADPFAKNGHPAGRERE